MGVVMRSDAVLMSDAFAYLVRFRVANCLCDPMSSMRTRYDSLSLWGEGWGEGVRNCQESARIVAPFPLTLALSPAGRGNSTACAAKFSPNTQILSLNT